VEGLQARPGILEAMADAGGDYVFLLDAEGRIAWTSAGTAERLGTPAPTLRGRPLAEAIALIGQPANPEALAAALEAGPGEAAQNGEVLMITDARHAQRWFQLVSRAVAAPELRGVAAVPGAGEGRIVRSLALFDVSKLMLRVARAERAKNAVERRLNFDTETGLPNERKTLEVLMDELSGQGENAGGHPVGVALVDVMDFRQIVDIHGAATGARVARELAETLAAHLPAGQHLARTKEHEFAVVFPEVASKKELVSIAERLSHVSSIAVATGLGDCRVQTLLAIAEMRPGDGTADGLLNNARIAMGFRGLPRRPGQIRIYEPEMRAALEARSRTYTELYAAIDNDEIEPFFQPQVSLDDRSVTGFEVLVRWRHPEQGLVPPGLFLEIAEETGLLPQIDDIVMRKSIACLARWRADGFSLPHISLNCTGESLRDPGYADKLRFELDRHDLAPGDVAIEILETVLLRGEQDTARQTLAGLAAAGFRLEIDDFGTGHASIAHLITLDADVVKLDRSLVRDVATNRANRLVVEATVALADKLGIETLAEGAEDEEQLALLAELGCHYVQGFGIARPMPFDEATRWMAEWSAPDNPACSA
jgi:diguanylate cyclase (GGDEF)-like protein